MVLWRTPWFVNELVRHSWLVALEVVSLIVIATRAWSALVQFAARASSLTHPQRLAACALVMWAVWVMAYLVGLSHGSWYRAYDHGQWLSTSADQQISTALLWAVSGVAFAPLVFWNLFHWLRREEQSNDELAERIRLERSKQRAAT